MFPTTDAEDHSNALSCKVAKLTSDMSEASGQAFVSSEEASSLQCPCKPLPLKVDRLSAIS